ncbi:MAG: Type 1 glutamine amidotransferase-like domain-containing protein [Candidatus Caenarcaniphilales bacterium]|nr:Type 1 glutamine amidotransferase-like domain-containing protein [Candidatus Caenarcaniphilales bacterium]
MELKFPQTFLLHGGCPDDSDQIDLFFKYLLKIVKNRKNKNPSLTLYPAGKYNDIQLRNRIKSKIQELSKGTCHVNELILERTPNNSTTHEVEIERLCSQSDIFLIMNGDTQYAAELGYQYNLPRLLERGVKNGMILSGWSCGAIINGIESISDSNSFQVNEREGETWLWKKVSLNNKTTFGFLNAIICAHEGQIRPSAKPSPYRSTMHKELIHDSSSAKVPVFLLPENTAIQIEDDLITAYDFSQLKKRPIKVFTRNDGNYNWVEKELFDGDKCQMQIIFQ